MLVKRAIKPASTCKGSDRLVFIAEEVDRILASVSPVDHVVIEDYAVQFVGSAIPVIEVGGVVKLTLHKYPAPISFVAATTLKKFATGKGKGDKSVVRLGAYKKWGFEDPSDDVVDAYVLARIAQMIVDPERALSQYEKEVLKAVRS